MAEQLSECLDALIQGVVWRHNLAKYLFCYHIENQSEPIGEALDRSGDPDMVNNTL